MKPKRFYVYIMTNRPRSHVLYTGVTGNLSRRVFEHKNKLVSGFTSRYNLTRLAYYECFVYPDAAINREKKIKGWSAQQEGSPDRIDESPLARSGGILGRPL
jgi:putative endonuclease